MEYVDSLLDEVQLQHHIDIMVLAYEDYIQLLMTIPSVSRKSAIIIISELGIDVSQWSSARKLSWSHGLDWLTAAMNQLERRSLLRFQRLAFILNHTSYRWHMLLSRIRHIATMQKFDKISKRCGKKRTIIAIARKILVAIYHILKTGKVFNLSDIADVETIKEQRITYIKKLKKCLQSAQPKWFE